MKEILIICAMEKESKTIAQELKLQKVKNDRKWADKHRERS